MAYVYCHFKEDDMEPFYVGIGRTKKRAFDMRGRSSWHKERSLIVKNGHKKRKINKLLSMQYWGA